MLVEVKARVRHVIDDKARNRTDSFIVSCNFYAGAEYEVTRMLDSKQAAGAVERFEIMSLKISPVKEVALQYSGENSFIVSLRDIFIDDNGNEKKLKYKILLWADSLQQAYDRAQEIAAQGYDMHIESIKEYDTVYIEEENDSQQA